VKKISYAGVFKLEKQTIRGGERDTSWIKEQIKIYTDQNYIYAGIAADSSIRIAIGSYELGSSDTIVEHNIFNSRALDSTQIIVVAIAKKNNGFISTVPEWARSGPLRYKLMEEYSSIPLTGPSSLDGVWELDKMYHVKGKDTTVQHETRFKVYWRGHFMLIHRYAVDELGTKFKDGFGYGDFSFKDNTLSETENISSHAELINQKTSTKIIFKGNNEYTQILNDESTHQQTTEIYKRLRKYSMF
jgi:hypothetical protein